MVSGYFSESTLKSALSKAKHEFDLAAEMVQLIEQGMVQTDVGDRCGRFAIILSPILL